MSTEQKHQYDFTTNWFEVSARPVWDNMIPRLAPKQILEIGSYEGRSTCYLIDKLATRSDVEIHCIDSWEGGIEHQAGGGFQTDMSEVERRFRQNTELSIRRATNRVDLVLHKGVSDLELSKLLAEGRQGYFDFIYVDGSHQAADVLCDAVLAFRLLRVGGVMAFDDYLWNEDLAYGTDPIRSPKIAIDAFTNIYCRKLRVMNAPLLQLYVRKTSD